MLEHILCRLVLSSTITFLSGVLVELSAERTNPSKAMIAKIKMKTLIAFGSHLMKGYVT